MHDVPVFRGAMTALCDPVPRRPSVLTPQEAENIAGLAEGYAAAELARRVVESPGQITIIAIGPLTNIASAINLEPAFARCVKEIVVMGGTYLRNLSWGSLPSEFNFWVDADAAQVVLRSGARLRLVGLDVTTQVSMSRADAQLLCESGGRFAAHAGARAQEWIDRLAKEYPGDPDTGDSCALHDPVAVTAVLRSDLLEWQPAFVDILTHDSLGRGVAVLDRLGSPGSRKPNCSVAVGVDAAAVRASIFGLVGRL